MRTKSEVEQKRKELYDKSRAFKSFLESIYKDDELKEKINHNLWRFDREIEILTWVLDDEIPF